MILLEYICYQTYTNSSIISRYKFDHFHVQSKQSVFQISISRLKLITIVHKDTKSKNIFLYPTYNIIYNVN